MLRVVLARYGEHRVIIGSTILAVACFAAFAVVSNGALAYVVMIISAFSGFASSGIQGLASNHVGEDVQGELNGAVMSAASIVQIIAPPVMTALFAWFTLENAPIYLPGAPLCSPRSSQRWSSGPMPEPASLGSPTAPALPIDDQSVSLLLTSDQPVLTTSCQACLSASFSLSRASLASSRSRPLCSAFNASTSL